MSSLSSFWCWYIGIPISINTAKIRKCSCYLGPKINLPNFHFRQRHLYNDFNLKFFLLFLLLFFQRYTKRSICYYMQVYMYIIYIKIKANDIKNKDFFYPKLLSGALAKLFGIFTIIHYCRCLYLLCFCSVFFLFVNVFDRGDNISNKSYRLQ